MNTLSVSRFEQRGVIDINAIRSNFVIAQLENISERNADDRAIVARVGNLSLAGGGSCPIPRAQHPVSAGRDRREKRRCSLVDGFAADDHGRIPEPKLRIRSEQINEVIRVAGIDNRKHALPPHTIGVRSIF